MHYAEASPTSQPCYHTASDLRMKEKSTHKVVMQTEDDGWFQHKPGTECFWAQNSRTVRLVYMHIDLVDRHGHDSDRTRLQDSLCVQHILVYLLQFILSQVCWSVCIVWSMLLHLLWCIFSVSVQYSVCIGVCMLRTCLVVWTCCLESDKTGIR